MDFNIQMHQVLEGIGYENNITDDEGGLKDFDSDDDKTDGSDDNAFSEDEKDDDPPDHKGLQDLLNSIKRKEIDWDNPKEYFGKGGRFSSHLKLRSERNQDCILHFLVKDNDDQETDEIATAIKFITRFYPRLMWTLNKESMTPLYCALDNLDKRRVRLIRKGFFRARLKPDHMAQAIATPCGVHRENCLHRALKSQPLHYPVLSLLVGSANQTATNAIDSQGYTPLHRAVQYEHSSENMLDIIKKLIDLGDPDLSLANSSEKVAFDMFASFETEKLSVYEYHMKTREKEEERERAREIKRGMQLAKIRGKEKSEADKGHPFEKPGLKTQEMQPRVDQPEKRNPNPSRTPVMEVRSLEVRVEARLDELPKRGIVRANTMATRDPANPKSGDRKDNRAKERHERERCSINIRNELKLYCLRKRTIARAARFLYGANKNDIQLYFDYNGLPEEADPGIFYNNFQMTQFDEVLQYVEFPTVRLREGKVARGEYLREHRELFHTKGIGRKDLLFFFGWLKDKGVKHIIKVIVQDSTDPHDDEVIRRCLSPFRIDVLDWSKPDLDPEMLCAAVPNVQELHLRWNGNNAVLRSWGEAEGLRLLKELRKIYLHHDQSSDYIKQKVDVFARRIAIPLQGSPLELANSVTVDDETISIARGSAVSVAGAYSTSPPIEVIPHGLPRSHLQTGGMSVSPATVHSKPAFTMHKWLQSIDNFSAELKTLMDKLREIHRDDEVKVALIDDGVDICERAFHDRVIHGTSFGYYWDGEQRAKQWYVSETGHGTVMAHMILRVCPMAKIYPIKLDNTKDPTTGAIKIKPESAAAAIDAAVGKDVHIISMSWTVHEPQGSDKIQFDEALAKATAKGILMFCSSPDNGKYSSDPSNHSDPYPSAYGPDKFFRIGASQANGHPYDWVVPDKVDYLFPGVDVVQANKRDIKLRGVEDRKAETGSSISTALAAGLAALVRWLVIIGAKYSSDGNQGDGDGLDSTDIRDIQNIRKMKQAFQMLGAGQESNGKFIEIWTMLDGKTKALKELHGDQNVKAARQVIHTLARNLIVKA
ncbi:hypothetical protein FE257_002656 [Aspergillus nanangensis]|uniref:Peptidase S8/S53 domain-containing protein n=1 Tax=Aspergillus nanangensis TaxID=2582783 RepID=A0AAD4CCT9_ASPNN|nr:hypothetical protein FE257_002656 [Aspergillus nanangensis]